MSHPITETIIDGIEYWRERGWGKPKDTDIYVHPTVWKELEEEVDLMSYAETRSIQPEKSPEYASMAEPDDPGPVSYNTYRVSHLWDRTLVEDPTLEEGEVVLFDAGAIRTERSGLGEYDPHLSRGNCVQRFGVASDPGVCAACGNYFEAGVEGDHGEVYCSISCLNEEYVRT